MMGRDWQRRPSANQLLGIASVRRARRHREWTLWLQPLLRFLAFVAGWIAGLFDSGKNKNKALSQARARGPVEVLVDEEEEDLNKFTPPNSSAMAAFQQMQQAQKEMAEASQDRGSSYAAFSSDGNERFIAGSAQINMTN